MFNNSIPVVKGDLTNCARSRVEAMGDVDVYVDARAEVHDEGEQEINSGNIGELRIQIVPVGLFSWRENLSNDNVVSDMSGNLHLEFKKIKDG